MRCYYLSIFSLFLLLPQGTFSQNSMDTFGNAWIREGQTYLRLAVADDGLFRIASSSLEKAGVPVNDIPGHAYQLFRHGQEEPLWISSAEKPLGPNDFLEFLGRRPRGELDSLFLPAGGVSLNPEVSLYTDSTLYFLTWSVEDATGRRYVRPVEKYGSFREVVTVSDTRVFRESFMQPSYQSYLQDSRLESSEGFGSAHRLRHQWPLSARGYMPDQGLAELTIRYATQENVPSRISFGANGQRLIYISTATSWQTQEVTTPFLPVQDQLSLFAEAEDGGLTLAFAKIRYPRSVVSLTAETKSVWVAGDSIPRILETDSGIWVQPDRGWRLEGGLLHLPASRKPWLFQPVSSIRWVKPTRVISPPIFPEKSADYHVMGPKEWMDPGGAGQALAAYRRSQAGGAVPVQTWDQEELAFWFGYGYERHPLAYRHWGQWMRAQGPSDFTIVLLGKTLTYVNQRLTKDAFSGPPTYGHPGSDYLLFQAMDSTTSPSIGRIAARTERELRAYLEKVQRYEVLLRAAPVIDQHYWRKRALHISGGRGSERGRFAVLLNQLERTLTHQGYGAEVINASKESDLLVDVSISQKAIDAINAGVGIKTFLGHGAVVNTDIGLDDPSLFEATDKTGLFFSLGCSTGNLFTVQKSVSERFVLAPDRGALAYIATAGVASDYDQFAFTHLFYEALGSSCFTCPLGTIMKQVRQQFSKDTSRIRQILTQQMTFHGDPALRLQVSDYPDYALDTVSVQMKSDHVLATLHIRNLGRNRGDTVPAQLLITSPSGKRNTYDTVVVVSGHLDLEWPIPYHNLPSHGTLELVAHLDPDQLLKEVSRENNMVPYPISVELRAYGPIPLFPPDDWIVTDTLPELWAAVGDAFATGVTYAFEVDTVPDFSSPFRKTRMVTGGSAARWRLEHLSDHLPIECTVFWRVHSPDGDLNYQPVHRFIYSPGRPGGWEQSHYGAFRQNAAPGFLVSPSDWTTSVRPVGILAMSVNQAPVSNDRSRLFLDNDSVDKVPNGKAAFTSYIFDKRSPFVWTSKTYSVLSFESRRALVHDLGAYPSGTPILLLGYTRKGFSFAMNSWPKDSLGLRGYLERQGATQLARLERAGSAPYAFAYRQDEEVLAEIPVPDSPLVREHILFSLPVEVDERQMTSPRIGPARTWKSVALVIADTIPTDQPLFLTFLAKAPSGDSLHWGTWPISNRKTSIDLRGLDARRWPYLLLRYKAKDRVQPIKSWTVDYAPATELTLADLSVPDTIWQGQPIILTGKVLVFPPHRGHIPIVLSLRGETQKLFASDTLEAPASFELPVSTESISGEWPIQLAVSQQHRLYPEWIKGNNQARKTLFVRPDQEAPILLASLIDQIPMPNQLAGTDPIIQINMIDDNPYGLISDSTLIDLQLTLPDGTTLPIPLHHPLVDLAPVNNPGDTLAITLQLQPAQRGQYTLLITGRDRFGNTTRSRFSFLVGQQQPSLSMKPFPNPFSSRVQFAYTYRGLVKASILRMVIVNKMGQVVRQVPAGAFGALLPGAHVWDWAWDGKDEAGRVVPDGVYGYRLEWEQRPAFGKNKSVNRTSGVLVKMR